MKDKPIVSNKFKSFFKKKIVTDLEFGDRNNCKSPIIKRNSISPVNYRGLAKSKFIFHRKKLAKYNSKILICFGICNYLHFDKLNNSINDVNALSKFFKETLNFDKIFIYTDENVTKSSIEKIITNDLYKNSGENDLIVFSFHGHGYSIDFDNFTEGLLVPYDASLDPTPFELISMNNLSKWFKYIRSRHILLLLDCCFSGLSVLRGAKKKVKKFISNNTIEISNNTIEILDNSLDNLEIRNNTLFKHLQSSSRIIINAGTNTDMVLDGGWNKNSVFTGAIISSPTFNNNIGSVFNLYYYLLKTISRYSNQSPSIGKMEGDMGTDIFLSI